MGLMGQPTTNGEIYNNNHFDWDGDGALFGASGYGHALCQGFNINRPICCMYVC